MTIGNAQSPFLNLSSFEIEAAEAQEAEDRATAPIRSPFVSVYEAIEGEGDYDDPVREAYSTIVNDLYDEEFDDALFELLTDVRNLHQDHLTSGHTQTEADRLVTQHVSQLTRECEAMVDAMARQFGDRDESLIVDREIESFVGEYMPSAPLVPAFENFFGKLLKKVGGAVKKVAGKALQGIKNLALGPLFRAIKKLVSPFLKNVLEKAIGKLPESLQPAARHLAQRLGFAVPTPTSTSTPTPMPTPTPTPIAPTTEPSGPGGEPAIPPGDVNSPVQEPVGAGVTELQLMFDHQIAEALLAQDEVELELEVARHTGSLSTPASPVFSDLDDARERFIRELDGLKEGEDPAPYVENFLPFVLPALRLGLRLIGRPRVVSYLSKLVAQPITRLIGPEHSPALSKAIVDAGFKLLNLELSEQETSGLAASGVAATVEETMNRVASLPEYVLDDQQLLEGFVLEAFEQAAASNLPSLFSDATYRARPDLLEAGVNAGWVMLPLRGRKRYKRCTRTFNVKITPYMAEEIESFEGAPLSDYLQDQLGLPEGDDVEVELHLYETLPGTTIADIARSESTSLGLGASDEATTDQLHPLTREAAGVLLGKPALGRTPPWGSDSRNIASGQRLFFPAIPGMRPRTVPGISGRRRPLRRSHVNVTLNCARDVIRVCIYMSEVRTQRFAVPLRRQAHSGSVTVDFHGFIARRLKPIFEGRRPRGLRIVKAGVAPGPALHAAFHRLPGVVSQVFIAKFQEWLVHGFSEFIKAQPQQFLSAADEPADGVTLVMTLEHPQGLKELGQLLLEKGVAASQLADILKQSSQPAVHVKVFPGHRCV
jgi:hypothetical protein